MSQSKPTLRSIYTMTSTTISTTMTEFSSLLAARQSYPFRASLGMMLLSLMLLVSIPVLMAAICTLSLLLLIRVTLMKLLELFSSTGMPGWNVQFILCRWADAVKNIPSMFKKSQTSVCNEDGDSAQDSTYRYSGMPGGLSEEDLDLLRGKKITEEQANKIRKQ